jgi:catechol 2,3-dioxygenase-like lactoylglutathione lyase family enzyme
VIKNKMENKSILRGLSTVSFYANDLEEAKKWYSNFLGIEPDLMFRDMPSFALVTINTN